MTNYSYSMSKISIDRLSVEISSSSITVALDHITALGSQVNINFKAELSNDEKTILDGIVAAHTGEPLPENAVINVKTVDGSVSLSTPTSPLNNYTMEPWGSTKGKFTSSAKACSITLSNKSEDGLTFTYALPEGCQIPIAIGNYIFQDDFCNKSWITEFDDINHTVTFDLPCLNNGTGHYSTGHYVDCLVRDWQPMMYLWGVSFKGRWTNDHDGRDDFMELSIVDKLDLFKDDDFCQAVFGCTAAQLEPMLISWGFELNGEYVDNGSNHWTKYYDESFVYNIDDKTFKSPDGAPGELLANLSLRISYFTSKTDNTENHAYIDYLATSKT